MWHVHPFSQRNKASKITVGEVGSNRKNNWTNLKKVEQAIYGGLHNIGGSRKLPPPMTHKELFWENDTLIV